MYFAKIIQSIRSYLFLADQDLQAWQVQESIEKAIARTGVRTLHGRTLCFGNTMVVYMSAAAYEVVRPVEGQVVAEIEKHLPAKLEQAGWALGGPALRLVLTVDAELEGLEVRVGAADRDVTPHQPNGGDAQDAGGEIVLLEVGGARQKWRFPIGREVILGRRPKRHRDNVRADIEFQNQVVSRLHARFRVIPTSSGMLGLEVFDIGSVNGTYIDDKLIDKRVTVRVRSGQTICLGGPEGVKLQVLSSTADPDSTRPYLPEAGQ